MSEDEDDFVDWVSALVDHRKNELGHDEDAVAVKIDSGYLVLNIDGWVESTDRPPGMTAEQCGYRAVANAVSDVIAKGAKPEAMVISMSIDSRHRDQMHDIIRGFRRAATDFSVAYLGGDMNSSMDLVIDVTVWGRTEKLVRRSGANPGDIVYWYGAPLGSTAAALGVLTKDWKGNREEALRVMGSPRLQLDFIDVEASSAIDCSDGLARSLHLLSRTSKVAIELEVLDISTPWIREVIEENEINPSDLALFGGEELAVVFTAHSKTDVPERSIVIGTVQEGLGVHFMGKDLPNKGWDHFKNLNSE